MKEVVIVSVARTPIGSFRGSLSALSATQLGGLAIKAAVERAGLSGQQVQEVYMGNVLSAGLGQAPATQAAMLAGLAYIPATAVNKVCASGIKAIMLAAQSISIGQNSVVVAGGMESMSNVPYYLDQARGGYKMGHGQITDGLIKDGLWDVYHDYHMGSAAELCACEYNITRGQQDAYAIESYKRAQQAQAEGNFNAEIVPVEVNGAKGTTTIISEDEEPSTVKFDKIPVLKPVFAKDGTVTAANASTLNDGAAALVLMSAEMAKQLGTRPLARIVAYADAQQAPEYFTTAPSKAIPLAVQRAGLTMNDINLFEINEAFSVVALANNQIMALNAAKVNVNGGAVALGHPLGASGARIVVTLVNALQQRKLKLGVAGICNGGGGASALVIESLV